MLNVKKILTKLMPTIGTSYIKFCGVGIAWGTDSSSGAWAKQISYGITFSANPIVLVSKAENATSPSNITVVSANTTTASVNFSSAANTKELSWIAIGKV